MFTSRIILGLTLLITAILRADEPSPTRTALLAWEAVPLRTDVQRVAVDLGALTQAELSSEPGIEWVERAELDSLLSESERSLSGTLDPSSALRLGRLASASIVLTGRLDASDPAASKLLLEAVDVEHADLLASVEVPLPTRPHKHYRLRDEDIAAATAALRELLSLANARRVALEPKPTLALLFLANTGPSSRLNSAGDRLADALRDAAREGGGRALRFPRAAESTDEQNLIVMGLADADPDSWKKFADLYAWGEYKELPAEGLAFELTPVEASLTLWDGVSAPRVVMWRGIAADFARAADTFSPELAASLHQPSAPRSATAREEATKRILDSVALLEDRHPASMRSTDFWKTELGLNFYHYRLRLLQTAVFLSPEDGRLANQLFSAEWSNERLDPVRGNQPETQWEKYLKKNALARRFPERQMAHNSPGSVPRISATVSLQRILQEIVRKNTGWQGDANHALAEIAANEWLREIERREATQAKWTATTELSLDFSFLLSLSDLGDNFARSLLERAWPVFAPSFGATYARDPGTARELARKYVLIFESFGQEDSAYRRLTAAINSSNAPATANTPRTETRPEPRRQSPDPAPVAPEWTETAEAASPISVRELGWSPVTPRLDAVWPSRSNAIQPRLLGHDGHRLWIDTPLVNAISQADRDRHRLATFSTFSRVLEPVPPPPELRTRLSAVVADENGVYFASEYEGLWLAGPALGEWRRFRVEDGLPSTSIAGIVSTPSGLVVATSAPENILARLDRTTGTWISIGAFPAADSPGRATLNQTLNQFGSGAPTIAGVSPAPRLAVAGDWVLASFDHPVIRNLRDPSKPDPIELRKARAKAESALIMEQIRKGKAPPGPLKSVSANWASMPAEVVLSDADSFWLAGEFGLVQLALSRLDEEILWEKDRPIHALADTGPFILAAFSSPISPLETHARGSRTPETKIGVFDKRSGRWVQEFSVPDAVVNLVAAPGMAWAAGANLHEIDLRRLDPDWRSAAIPLTDPAMRAFGLADQRAFAAIVKDDAAALKVIIAEASPPSTPPTGLAPLHLAAAVSSPEIVDLLLANGAAPDAFSADGRTPLSFAAARGDMAVVDRLLNAGANPNAQGRPHNRRLMLDPLKPAPDSATPPVQPTSGRAELLPDGRVRLHWQAPPDSAMSYSLYRKDSQTAGINIFQISWRHAQHRSGWTDIGKQIDSSIPGGARTWIDIQPRPAGSTCVYTLIAETGDDRFGPPAPAPLVTHKQPAESPLAPIMIESSPAFVDSTPLQHAAAAGHLPVVTRFLANGADPALTAAAGHGASHFAVLGGNDEILQALLQAGAPLELAATGFYSSSPSKSDSGALHPSQAGTVLHYVYLAHRDRALFDVLLAAGANQGSLQQTAARLGREADVAMLRAAERRPFQSLHSREPPFITAYLAGRHELSRRLRDAEFSPNASGWPDEKKFRHVENTLMTAVKANDLELTRWLLERGAKPGSSSENSHLGIAITTKNPDLVRALVQHGAAPSELRPDMLVAITDPAMKDALSISVVQEKFPFPWSNSRSFRGQVSVGRWGQQATPEALAADAALHQAAARGDVAGIRIAFASGAHVDAKADKGWTALIHALAGKHVEAARVLIDAGATLNFVTHKGSPPIVFAVDIGDMRLIEEMLDLGAAPDLVEEKSSSALHVALVRHPEIAKLLVARGANPESIMHVGGLGDMAPPIFRLALHGELAAIRLVVELGADPRRALWRPRIGKASFGLTALPYAAASNDVATLDYFIDLGLDVHWTAEDGYGALDWALNNNADRTADRLRALGVKTRGERGLPKR